MIKVWRIILQILTKMSLLHLPMLWNYCYHS